MVFSRPKEISACPSVARAFVLIRRNLSFPNVSGSNGIIIRVGNGAPSLQITFRREDRHRVKDASRERTVAVPFPSLRLLGYYVKGHVGEDFGGYRVPTTQALQKVAGIVSFITTVSVLFRVTTSATRANRPHFPKVVFPCGRAGQFSVVPNFMGGPNLWALTGSF